MAMTGAVKVDPSNAEALRAWDGSDGAYWAERERLFNASLARYRDAFFAAAALEPADRVLDVGCGTGETTCDAARVAADGFALGVDLSSRMVERAREQAAAEGVVNVAFEQTDAQVHPFEAGAYDVAISRTGAMFFGDPVAAFANIGRALRPGGRLVLFVWRSMPENEWFEEFRRALSAGRDLPAPPPDAPGPFSLADPERVCSVLEAAGFSAVELQPVDEFMCFGADGDEAYDFLAGQGFTRFLLQDLDDETRRSALEALRATVDDHVTDNGVLYRSAAWIITATRP